MKMRYIKKVWNDPVGSKIISSIIIAVMSAVIGIVCTFIEVLKENKDFWQELQQVFCYKVNLWLALGCFLGVWVLSGFLKRKSVVAIGRKELPFVKEFVEGRYQNQIWRWRWQWSPTYKLYYIKDLDIVCPMCKDGLLTLGYMNYRCAKCGADIPYNKLNTASDAVKKQILADGRERYVDYADKIGELPIGMVKA